MKERTNEGAWQALYILLPTVTRADDISCVTILSSGGDDEWGLAGEMSGTPYVLFILRHEDSITFQACINCIALIGL